MNELYEVISALFTNKDKFATYSDMTLGRNSFMLNRTLAINYPLQANALNLTKINSCDIVKSWNEFIQEQYRCPGFVYTKGSKKSQVEKSEKNKMPKKDDIVDYCLTYNISYKSVMDAFKFFKDEMIEEINEFKKIKEQQK